MMGKIRIIKNSKSHELKGKNFKDSKKNTETIINIIKINRLKQIIKIKIYIPILIINQLL